MNKFIGSKGCFKDLKIISLAFLSLFFGGLVYVFLRPMVPDFVQMLTNTWLENPVGMAREVLAGKDLLPDWIVFSLPNGLWSYAYTLTFLLIWYNNKSKLRFVWYVSIPIIVIGYEVAQLTGIFPGTFCLIDIVLSGAGIIAGVFTLIILRVRLKNNRH